MLVIENEARLDELEAVINFFEKYNKNNIFVKTSNILTKIAQEKIIVEKDRKTIEKTKLENEEIFKQPLRNYFERRKEVPNVAIEVNKVQAELHNLLKSTMKDRTQGKKYIKVNEPHKKPDDDNDDVPRIYEKSQKHPDYKTVEDVERLLAKGISPSPQNGQAVLDGSIRVKDGARVAIENGYFIIFLRHRCLPEGGSLYHGFIETWDLFKSRDDYRNALAKKGLISQNGKIL